jgi:hypothetical protein
MSRDRPEESTENLVSNLLDPNGRQVVEGQVTRTEWGK